MQSYQVIVVGLGAMGGAAVFHLARRGARVLGLEQATIGHARSGSGGVTRLYRRACFEHEGYGPLLDRAISLWEELALLSGEPLHHPVGLLTVGTLAPGGVIPRMIASAARPGVVLEQLDLAAIRRRFPRFRVPEAYHAVFEPGAGYVEAERSIQAHCALARRHGADLREAERALTWAADGEGVRVTTDAGVYRADALVVAAGPWSASLLAGIGVPLTARPIPQAWFDVEGAPWAEGPAPCFLFDLPGGPFYGVFTGDRVKVGGPSLDDEIVDPSRIDPELGPDEIRALSDFVLSSLPGVRTTPALHARCMCTFTPDGHAVIDAHPAAARVAFAAGFSGHGFKLAPVVGEILADIALEGRSRAPIDFLRLRRETLLGSRTAASQGH